MSASVVTVAEGTSGGVPAPAMPTATMPTPAMPTPAMPTPGVPTATMPTAAAPTATMPSGATPEASLPALIDALVAADRLVNSVTLLRTELIEAVRLASLEPDAGSPDALPTSADDPARASMVTELACALRVPEGTMSSLVDNAETLMADLPATVAALRDGSISYRHAQVMIENLHGLGGDARARSEERLIPQAQRLSVARFKNRARRERERVAPIPIEVRHECAVAERRVYLEHADDGVSWLHALLPSAAASAAFNRLSAVAASLQHPDDGRTLPQLRADALSDLLLDDDALCALGRADAHCAAADADADADADAQPGDGAGGTPRSWSSSVGEGGEDPHRNDDGRRGSQARRVLRNVRATVAVTVPVLTLLGADAPGELAGYGPIDAETARELAGGASSFLRILTHPHTGAVLGVDRDRYAVPADLKSWLRMRDERCRFPGCARDATRCDLDHVTDWAKGGTTDQANLIHLCRRHHRLRHTTGWEAEIITHQTGGVGRASGNGDGTGAPESSGGSGQGPGTKGQRPPEAGQRPPEAGQRPPEAGQRPPEAGQGPVGASVHWTAPSGRTYTTHDALHERHDAERAVPGKDVAGEESGASPDGGPNWIWLGEPGSQPGPPPRTAPTMGRDAGGEVGGFPDVPPF